MLINNMTLSEIEAHMYSGDLKLTQEEMRKIINHILEVLDKFHINTAQKISIGEVL